MAPRRESLVRYTTHCDHLPIPGQFPLRVPVEFDYNVVRDHIEEVMTWMISRTTGATGQLFLGPQLRYIQDRSGNTREEMYTPEGHGPLDGARATRAMEEFVTRVTAPLVRTARLGVATLRWSIPKHAHRSILLVDGRDGRDSPLRVYLVDPNGALHPKLKPPVMKFIKNIFTIVRPSTRVFFADTTHDINVSSSLAFSYIDRREHKLGRQTDPGAYCVIASLMLIADVLCTRERVLSTGHIARLSADLSGGATDPEAARYNRLMAMRSYVYELLVSMQRDGVLTHVALPNTISFSPLTVIPKNPIYKLQTKTTVSDLRDMCRKYGVDSTGSKEDLVRRLADILE